MGTEILIPSQLQDPTSWHAGNIRMQTLMSAPSVNNPTALFLTPSRALMLTSSPLLAIGTIDFQGRPWTSLWGGEKGCMSPLGQTLLGVNSVVDRQNDPVLQACLGRQNGGKVFGEGQIVSALGIDLETRRRVKLSGRIAGATLSGQEETGVAQSQVVLEVDSSLGNCPKYLNAKKIVPTLPRPVIEAESLPLSSAAISLIAKADMFFLTASASGTHLSTNHRGGPRGFMRVLSNTSTLVQIAYPEYSGNRLYQTLGNLQVTARAGIVIPDFETGDAIYATCETQILVQDQAAALIPRSNLVVVFTLNDVRFVRNCLAFRASDVEASPYNPPVRPLATEKAEQTSPAEPIAIATLVEREHLTDDVAYLRFRTNIPVSWKPGQHVGLSFETELGTGYAHMNNEDPQSLNDDLVRNFTVTSIPPRPGTSANKFELLVRKVGKVTNHLQKANIRAEMSMPVLGFGGDFRIETENEVIGFFAGGVGITPLLGQLEDLKFNQLELWWSVNARDLPIVKHIVGGWKQLPTIMLFVSGSIPQNLEGHLEQLGRMGIVIQKRRISKNDLGATDISKWYMCAGPALKREAEEWLAGKEIISEDFNY